MKSYRYTVVDVFTTEVLKGNALAVFPDASDLDATTMQKIAREFNLTETVFVLPATRKDCAATLRIFTPAKELPFAGHPTVGGAFVLLQKGIVPKNSSAFAVEEQIGTVPIRVDGGPRPMIWLRTPPIHEGRCFDSALCAAALGLEPEDLLPIEPQLLNAGNPTVIVAAKDKAAVDRAWLDLVGLKTLKGGESEPFCVFLFTPTPEGDYSRMFAPDYGVAEDPATGSSTGPLAAYMIKHKLVSGKAGTRFVSEQGTKMGRRSFLHVEIQGEQGADGIYVGGHVTPIAEGVMRFDSHADSKEKPMLQDEFERQGMKPADARFEARRAYSGIEQAKELHRDERSIPWVEQSLQDARYALRTLLKSPGFTAVALLTLALGIGANIAIFTIVNAVLLRPLPFPESERLVRVFDDLNGTGAKDVGLSVPELDDLRDRSGLFESVSAIFPSSTALRGGDRSERIEGLTTSFEYFRLLGANAALGRVIGPSDAVPGFTEAVVISDGLWRRQFGADPHVLGRRILADEDGYTIVGVMPPDFRHPGQGLTADVELWTAAGFKANPFPIPPSRTYRYLPGALGRLKAGLTVQQAQQRLDAFVAELSRSYPMEYPAASRWSVRLESIEESWTGSVRPMLVVLLAAVGFVLLIVAVNLASLLVARSSARTREIAIRQALGASRPRLVRQLLTESILLSLAGGMSAVAVLMLAKKSLLALMPADLPRLNEVHFDARVVVLAFALSLLTGVLFGLTPALQASDADPNEDLKEGTRGGSPSARKNRFRGFLVAVEIALSVVLLSAAGLLLHSFWNSMQSNPGFNPNQLMVARIWIPFPNNPEANHYRTVPPIAAMSHEVLRLARELPGVQEAAMGGNNSVPLVSNTRRQTPFSLPDEPDSSQKQRTTETALVSPEYFHVLGIPLLRGRGFTEADSDKTKPVVVVSESFATQYLRKRDLGARIGFAARRGFEPRTLEIVGVVGDVHADGLDTPAAPRIYLALYQRPANEMAIFLRGALNSSATKQAVRGVVEGVNLNLPVYGIRTMQEMMANSLERRRFALTLMALFGALALFLASIGIYGVMAYAVGKRSQEFSIRMALGAEPRDILLLAFRPGVVLTCIGIAVGLLGALGSARLMSSLLYGVAPYDPVTFGVVVAVLALVALAACGIPARRAIRIAPATALRS